MAQEKVGSTLCDLRDLDEPTEEQLAQIDLLDDEEAIALVGMDITNEEHTTALKATSVADGLGSTAVSDDQDNNENGWQNLSNCLGVDPDLFFPERGASTREAKEVCKGCVVRGDCLEYALSNGEKFGIWGGLSERERRRIRKQRAVARRSTLGSTNSELVKP
ncbi:MAG: WhiB family transcriptional regulator, redox-sensing transcriptional regulator [Patescibacteria group bacterium]|nr:WhiB family transcriptional regulator, redox-sensing transcriptional regulator [Patescibacteria group bacterium]